MSSPRSNSNYGFLNFFEIIHSGLYTVQKKSSSEILSKSYGLDTVTVLKAIKGWVEGRHFKETASWVIDPDAQVADKVMCYCKEIYECDNGDFILVLWKHDQSDVAGWRGLRLDSTGVPSGEYYTNSSSNYTDDVVWGHPCFYWIIPEADLVISIKFEDSKCDASMMQKWIKSCVRNRLQFDGYNARKASEGSTRITFSTPQNPEKYDVLYRFSKGLIEFKTTEEHLEHICATTKHVLLRNEVVTSSKASDLSDFETITLDECNKQIFDFLGKVIAKFFSPTESTGHQDDGVRRVEVKLEVTPTIEDMKSFMDYASSFDDEGWSDVIFIDHDNKPTSIKKHRLTGRVVMPKTRDVYAAKDLEAALKELRSSYLDLKKGVVAQDSAAQMPQSATSASPH